MAKEKFKTMIGGQALIEGIMMRGPEKDAIVVRTSEGLKTEVIPRKVHSKNSPLSWPLIRGPVNFFDAQLVGIRALMKSADLNPEVNEEESSKFDKWMEKKLGDQRFQNSILTILVCFSLLLSIGLFFVLPMLLGSVFEIWVSNTLALNLIEGLIRVMILVGYMFLASLPKDMKRVFAYHGAEHKTICCYEAGLPLTVENVRPMPVPPPLRHQLSAGCCGTFGAAVLCGIHGASQFDPRIGCHPGNYWIPSDYDGCETVAAASSGVHRL